MGARIRASAAIALLTVVGVDRAHAQTAAVNSRLTISVNAGVQPTSIGFDSSTTQPLYLEHSVFDTSYEVRNGVLVDGGVLYRIAGGLSVGGAVSWLSMKRDSTVNATLPHPFFFRTPRSLEGTAADLLHRETILHVQAAYSIRPAARFDVTFAGGPSFFRVDQDFVDNVSYTDTYPYDAPSFTAASSTRVRGDRTGFNAGADLGILLSRHAGVGVLVRYSRARMQFALPDGSTATADAGGLQVAGGVRVFF